MFPVTRAAQMGPKIARLDLVDKSGGAARVATSKESAESTLARPAGRPTGRIGMWGALRGMQRTPGAASRGFAVAGGASILGRMKGPPGEYRIAHSTSHSPDYHRAAPTPKRAPPVADSPDPGYASRQVWAAFAHRLVAGRELGNLDACALGELEFRHLVDRCRIRRR